MGVRITHLTTQEAVLEYRNQNLQTFTFPIRIPKVYDPNQVYSCTLDQKTRSIALAPTHKDFSLNIFKRVQWTHFGFFHEGQSRIVLLYLPAVKKHFPQIINGKQLCEENRLLERVEQEFSSQNIQHLFRSVMQFIPKEDRTASFSPLHKGLKQVTAEFPNLGFIFDFSRWSPFIPQNRLADANLLTDSFEFLGIEKPLDINHLSFNEMCNLFCEKTKNSTSRDLGLLLFHLALQKESRATAIKMVLSARRPIQLPENLVEVGKSAEIKSIKELFPVLLAEEGEQHWLDLFEGAFLNRREDLLRILLSDPRFLTRFYKYAHVLLSQEFLSTPPGMFCIPSEKKPTSVRFYSEFFKVKWRTPEGLIFYTEIQNPNSEELGNLLYNLTLKNEGRAATIKTFVSSGAPIQLPENLIELGKNGEIESIQELFPLILKAVTDQHALDLFEGAFLNRRKDLIQLLLKELPALSKFNEYKDWLLSNEFLSNSRGSAYNISIWGGAFMGMTHEEAQAPYNESDREAEKFAPFFKTNWRSEDGLICICVLE